MMCTTVLHGGVCHRTSTPHKSGIRRDHVERKLEEWRRAMEERGLKIGRRKTEYLGCNEHQDAEIGEGREEDL